MTITLRAPRGFGRLAPALRALVRTALAGEGCRAGEIGIVLAGDAELRTLNRRWRGLDRATDVLSFPYDEPGAAGPGSPRAARARRGGAGARSAPDAGARPRVRGDLVISMDRVNAQARRYRVSRGRELARLVVHGGLHLAGLDHQRPAERSRMRSREDRVLAAAAGVVRALEKLLAGGS